jgi:hypothetical protein
VRDKRVVVVKWVGDYGVDIESPARQRTTDWDMLVVAVVQAVQKPEQV